MQGLLVLRHLPLLQGHQELIGLKVKVHMQRHVHKASRQVDHQPQRALLIVTVHGLAPDLAQVLHSATQHQALQIVRHMASTGEPCSDMWLTSQQKCVGTHLDWLHWLSQQS